MRDAGCDLLRRARKKARIPIIAAPPTPAPTPMPAFAPVDKPEESDFEVDALEPELVVAVGSAVDDEVLVPLDGVGPPVMLK